jgi:hypothetical protein
MDSSDSEGSDVQDLVDDAASSHPPKKARRVGKALGRLKDALKVSGSDSESEFEDVDRPTADRAASSSPSNKAHGHRETLAEGVAATGPERGLLSNMIHEVLGNPADTSIEHMILMNAKKGQPEWARLFSNLQSVGDALAPERVYQASRFEGGIPDGAGTPDAEHKFAAGLRKGDPSLTEEAAADLATKIYDGPVVREYPSSFSVLDEWWNQLPEEQQLDELAKLRKDKSRDYWRGVSGIFAKILKGAITAKKGGTLAMKKTQQKPTGQMAAVKAWLDTFGLTIPKLREGINTNAVMKEAVRAKLESGAFEEHIRLHRKDGKLPYWIGELPIRGSGKENPWVVPAETRALVAKRR